MGIGMAFHEPKRQRNERQGNKVETGKRDAGAPGLHAEFTADGPFKKELGTTEHCGFASLRLCV